MATTVDAVRRFRFGPILAATVLTVLILWMFGRAADVFLLLFLSVLISLYLGSLRDLLVRRLHLPSRLAFVAALLLTLGGIVGLVALLVPPVVAQTQQLIGVLPDYITRLESQIGHSIRRYPGLRDLWRPSQHQLVQALYDQLVGPLGDFVPKVFSIVRVAIDVFAVLIMSIYLSLYPGIYREWLIAVFPPIHRDLIRDVLADLGTTLRAYIVGQLLTMTVLAVLTAIGLYLLRVPYWLTFGVFTGAVAVVPFFGTLFSTTLPALFVLGGPGIGSFGGPGHAMLVILLGTVIHLIEGNLVMPLITAKQVELPPVLTILSVLVIGKIMGGIGLLVAVPLLVVVMVIMRRILINRIYEGQGFRRATRDRPMVLRVPAPDGGVLVSDATQLDVLAVRDAA
jgi:predicted PurR-regulated permease PerM